MKIKVRRDRSNQRLDNSLSLDKKLASYLAASASIGAVMASDASAIIVSNSQPQTVGINGIANIDFNSDGQVDFQIDHDRVDLTSHGGPVVDYLQLDKNDINSETNPLPVDTAFPSTTFPPNGTTPNDAANSSYVVQTGGATASTAEYPSALMAGAEIGQGSKFDFQEGDNVQSSGKTGRLNRLIDEDHGQVDMLLGGKTAAQVVSTDNPNTAQFVGVENLLRYVGVRVDLNDANPTGAADGYTYGWIGIKITNEANATADVVGWGYETRPGISILAGDTGLLAGDYNNDGRVNAADYVTWRKGLTLQNETATIGSITAEDYTVWHSNFGGKSGPVSGFGTGGTVPEPGSALLSLLSGIGLIFVFVCRRIRGK